MNAEISLKTICVIAYFLHISVGADNCNGTCTRVPSSRDCSIPAQAPDHCDCMHWRCQPQVDDSQICPSQFEEYQASDGTVICIYMSIDVLKWSDARERCDLRFNSDLMNIREIEEILENDKPVYDDLINELSIWTQNKQFWIGLHIPEEAHKLYWDSDVPTPDRDLTSNSESLVVFNGADWNAIEGRRWCMMLAVKKITPEFCTALFPYICSKIIPASRDDFFTPKSGALCEDGWKGSIDTRTCYKYNANLQNFDDAINSCDGDAGKLADPTHIELQGFIGGILFGLSPNESPLTVYVGLKHFTSQGKELALIYNSGVNPLEILLNYPIDIEDRSGILELLGWDSGRCGVYWNPVYAEGRKHNNSITFGACDQLRPSICTKPMRELRDVVSSDWRVILRHVNNTLYCDVEGIRAAGKIVWKKNHQYFINQLHTTELELNSTNYKYMIADPSGREINHSEMSGIYQCEFWQTLPRRNFSSEELAVTYNDTLGLRLQVTLNIRWSPQYSGFTYRVTQNNEMSAHTLNVYNELKTRVMETLEDLKEPGITFNIHILSFRPADDGSQVTVDYKISTTGPQIERIQSNPQNAQRDDVMFLSDVINTLENSSLVDSVMLTIAPNNNHTGTVDTGVSAQFVCLELNVTHPDTGQHVTLPFTMNHRTKQFQGACSGEMKDVITAECKYSRDTLKSHWVIDYRNCPTNCSVKEFEHETTRERFRSSAALIEASEEFRGSCYGEEQLLMRVICEVTSWRVEQIPCLQRCHIADLPLPDEWSRPAEFVSVSVGAHFKIELLCNKLNQTALEADCDQSFDTEYNESATGIWNHVQLTPCMFTCEPVNITHETGHVLHLGSAPLGTNLTINGCNGFNNSPLAEAVCVGSNAEGAEWSVSLLPCHMNCNSKSIMQPDTNATVLLGMAEINTSHSWFFKCNGEEIQMNATCSSDLTNGMEWRVSTLQRCQPKCPSKPVYHNSTHQWLELMETDFNRRAMTQGDCGGAITPLIYAQCLGDLKDGVRWEIEEVKCILSCPSTTFVLEDLHKSVNIPSKSANETYEIRELCNGEEILLVEFTCIVKRDGHSTEWSNQTVHHCVGKCNSETLTFEESDFITDRITTTKHTMNESTLGHSEEFIKDCDGEPATWLKVSCVGNSTTGGHWEQNYSRCESTARCAARYFVHPDTLGRIEVGEGRPNEGVALDGMCRGERVHLMVVTCAFVQSDPGEWIIGNITECDTPLYDRLTNLFEGFKDKPGEIAHQMVEQTDNITNINTNTLQLVTVILEFLADPTVNKSIEGEGDSFISIVDNLLVVDSEQLSNVSDSMLTTVGEGISKATEKFFESAEMSASKFTLQSENLKAEVYDTFKMSDKEVEDMKIEEGNITLTLSPNITNNKRVSMVVFKKPSLFQSANMAPSGGVILSANIAHENITDVDSAVTFRMEKPTSGDVDSLICGYWSYELVDWAEEGCELVNNHDNKSVTCKCNHLTNFAILLDIRGQNDYIADEHHTALSVITMTGLIISMIALGLHLISFLAISKLRENQFQKVLANLALSIFLTNLVFLVGIDKTENEAGCIAVAVLLHYFILVSFCWMFVEAFMQYRRFVVVFQTHVSHILLKAGLPAWLGPMIVPAIVLLYDKQLYKGGDRFCWMKTELLYYAMIIPIGCIILANLVLFILILRGLTCSRTQKLRTNKSESEIASMYFKAGLAVFSLLGITWIFGFFAISDARLAFQYLFTIFNAFQGLVIFVIHNIRDPKVQQWWRKVLHLKPKKPRGFSGSSQATQSSTVSHSSRNNTQRFPTAKSSVANLPALKEKKVERNYQLITSKEIYASTESETSTSASELTQTSETTINSDL